MKPVPNRLKGVRYGALTLCLLLLTNTALAQQKTLYIGMNGGNMERTYTQSVFGPFEKENNVNVVVVPGGSGDLLAKAQATKARPQMHVLWLDDGVMYRAISMGLCERMRPNPYLQDLPQVARLQGDMATAVVMSMTGLAYNTKIFFEKGWQPPTSWKDLENPKYQGKIVVQSISASTFGLHAFLMINRLNGGNEKNVEPGFAAWPKTVGPNVLEYIPNSAKVAEMAQAGEVALFPYTPGQTALLKRRGIPVAYAQPKEGSVLLLATQCVVANNSEPELAQKLAAYLISPQAQGLALKNGGFPPSNRNTPAEGEAAKEKARIEGYAANSIVLDWDVVNASRPQWNTRWNRTIER